MPEIMSGNFHAFAFFLGEVPHSYLIYKESVSLRGPERCVCSGSHPPCFLSVTLSGYCVSHPQIMPSVLVSLGCSLEILPMDPSASLLGWAPKAQSVGWREMK